MLENIFVFFGKVLVIILKIVLGVLWLALKIIEIFFALLGIVLKIFLIFLRVGAPGY